jgi:hypothetical protein
VPDADRRAALADQQRRLSQSQDELNRLRRLSEQQAKIAQLLRNPQVRQLAEQAASAQTVLSASTATRTENLQQAASDQGQATQVADALAALDKALSEARQRLAAVDQELAAEKKMRSRPTHLPRKQQTTKTQVAYLLRDGGRLYAYHKSGPGGRLERDTADTQVLASGTERRIVPAPGGGVAIDARGDASGVVAKKLASWDPRRNFITVFVWPDSFEHYFVMRQHLLERGFEYQLRPVTHDFVGPVVGTARTDVQGTQ